MAGEEQREQGFLHDVAALVGAVFRAVFGKGHFGGELKAAFYQGADEAASALCAFPDAIQIEEPGTAFNPLYRDRDGVKPAHSAKKSQPEASAEMSPMSIAQESRGSVHGDPVKAVEQRSPSEIANAPQASMSQQQQGQEHDQGHSHGR